jgi:hypothetical protein
LIHGLIGGPGILLLFDTTFTFFRRLRKSENVFAAHRSHLSQRLVISRCSHRFVTLIYLGLALIGTILSLLWFMRVDGSELAGAIILPLLCLGLWTFVIYQEKQQATKQIFPPLLTK